MLDAPRIVDRVTGTQIIKPVRGSRMFTAGKQKGVDHPLAAHHRLAGAFQLGIEESQVEHRIVGNDLGIAEKLYELSRPMREQWLLF
jgi:hypothetical protein